jgi:hypothetical protein
MAGGSDDPEKACARGAPIGGRRACFVGCGWAAGRPAARQIRVCRRGAKQKRGSAPRDAHAQPLDVWGPTTKTKHLPPPPRRRAGARGLLRDGQDRRQEGCARGGVNCMSARLCMVGEYAGGQRGRFEGGQARLVRPEPGRLCPEGERGGARGRAQCPIPFARPPRRLLHGPAARPREAARARCVRACVRMRVRVCVCASVRVCRCWFVLVCACASVRARARVA